MQNSLSLHGTPKPLGVIRERSGAVRSRHFCERLPEKAGTSAPDHVGTPVAELISDIK
jgi:hypothetical protein